jgi:hypothetical protein
MTQQPSAVSSAYRPSVRTAADHGAARALGVGGGVHRRADRVLTHAIGTGARCRHHIWKASATDLVEWTPATKTDRLHPVRTWSRRILPWKAGEFLAAIPSQYLASTEADGLTCRIRVHDHRSRKTRPCHRLVLVNCMTHGLTFTLYPPRVRALRPSADGSGCRA